MPVLNFLCVQHIQFYRVNQPQAFQLFQSLFFQAKMVNHCEGYVIFQDVEHQLQQNILHHFLHYRFFFFEIFIKLSSTFDSVIVIYWKFLRHCPSIQIIYIPILKSCIFFIFIIIFQIFVISFCLSINRATYSSFNKFSYH